MSLDCIIESHLLLIIKKLITPFTLGVIHIPICSRCDGLLRNLCKSRILFCKELQHRIYEILIFLCWYLVNTLQICAYRVQLFKTVLHFSFSKEFLCLGINLYCDRLWNLSKTKEMFFCWEQYFLLNLNNCSMMYNLANWTDRNKYSVSANTLFQYKFQSLILNLNQITKELEKQIRINFKSCIQLNCRLTDVLCNSVETWITMFLCFLI